MDEQGVRESARQWTEHESALKAFMESAGHTLCELCRCCDMVPDDEPCWNCGGEGFRELYEEDPLWYDPDDIEICDVCQGEPRMICIGGCGDKPHEKRTVAATKGDNSR